MIHAYPHRKRPLESPWDASQHRGTRKTVVQTFKARAWTDADGSGEFAIPEVDDGTYLARILDVEDRFFASKFSSESVLKYMVKWELRDVKREDGTLVTLTQFVRVPDGLIANGYIHPKANLFKFMIAIGRDPAADDFEVDPMEWIGTQATIWVENTTTTNEAGQEITRPQISKVTPKPKAQATTRTTQRAAPPPPADWDEPDVQ